LSGSGDIVVLRVVGTDGWAWFGTAVTEELDATLEACAIPKREGSAWDASGDIRAIKLEVLGAGGCASIAKD